MSARTASGAEVIIHPQEDRLIVRVAAGLPEIELHLTPAGAVLRTAAPSLTLEAPERLRFAAPRVEIAAKELDVRAERALVPDPDDSHQLIRAYQQRQGPSDEQERRRRAPRPRRRPTGLYNAAYVGGPARDQRIHAPGSAALTAIT